jgi:hypothetical protein
MFLVRRPQAGSRSRLRRFCEWFKELLREDHSQARGLELLREWLSPAQLVQFERERHFDVVGCDSGKRYRISYGSSMNIHELDDTARRLFAGASFPTSVMSFPAMSCSHRRSRWRLTSTRPWRWRIDSRPRISGLIGLGPADGRTAPRRGITVSPTECHQRDLGGPHQQP